MSSPVCENLREISIKNLKKLKLNFHPNGTYICIEGPNFLLAESICLDRGAVILLG